MSQTEKKPGEQMKAGLRQSQQYNPDFELWWNGPLFIANQNIINSYRTLEFIEESEAGFRRSTSKVPDDLFVRRVLIMWAVLLPDWLERAGFKAQNELIEGILSKGEWPTSIEALNLYRAMVKLLNNDLKVIKLKPPWDPAD